MLSIYSEIDIYVFFCGLYQVDNNDQFDYDISKTQWEYSNEHGKTSFKR